MKIPVSLLIIYYFGTNVRWWYLMLRFF
uniref:Uncharacterized protein n=1 Tax=Anguilla anguilla TaxID=7936 RepID=A0A0E9W3N8_ANGAN